MAILDVTIVNIAFPDIRASFPHNSLSDLSWILNGYNIVFAAALVPAGRLADRIGRKKLFIVGVLVFVAASLLCGVSVSVGMLVAARVLQALGGAILTPSSLSLILPEFPVEQRATATALWTATGAVAAATGPSIGAALLALGVGALALAIVKGPQWGWTSAGVLGALITAAVLLALSVVRSARHPSPVIELALFRVRSFTVANAGGFVFAIGFFALLLCNVLFLTTIWRYSVLGAGAALTPGPITAAAMAPLAGRLADRFGPRAIAVPGSLLFAAGSVVFTLATGPAVDYWSVFLPGAVLGGAGIGLALPAFGSAAVAELPGPRFATGIAASSCFRQIGAVVGVALLVAVLGTPSPGQLLSTFHRCWAVIAATGLACAVISLALGRIRARQVETIPAGPPARAAETP